MSGIKDFFFGKSVPRDPWDAVVTYNDGTTGTLHTWAYSANEAMIVLASLLANKDNAARSVTLTRRSHEERAGE